jgi:hypothetical protein
MRMNIEKVPKPSDVDADPAQTWGRLPLGNKRARLTLFESTGALVTACPTEEFCGNTGDPAWCLGETRQPEARKGRAGPRRKSERPIVLEKPGNAGGGKGP